MPADWGFGRYGQDLFLPVPEYSSFFGAEVTSLRAEVGRTVFGVENNYSPELNLRMRLLYSLLLDVMDNQAYYDSTIQPALIGIMQDKSIPNLLTTLRALMVEQIGSTKSQITDMDELMDYFIRVFSGAAAQFGFGSADENAVSPLRRLFTEHFLDSYQSSIIAIRNQLFEPSTAAYYVMVRGPVTVSIAFSDDAGESIVRMDASGQNIVITVHFLAGAALFLLYHFALICFFLRRQSLPLRRWVQWGVIAAPLTAVILLFYTPSHGVMAWAAGVYAPVMLLTVFCASGQTFRVRAGALMFVASDFLLVLFSVLVHEPLIHAIYMGLFYAALLLPAIGERAEELRADL